MFQANGPFQALQRILTPAEIIALNTSPIQLLPARSGVAYIPYLVTWYKPAGAAYTSPANISIETDGGTAYATLTASGFMDSAVEQFLTARFGAGTISTALTGLGLRLKAAGTMAAGDALLRVKMVYIEEYPGLL
jgi:hypothetical protein